MTVFNFAPSGKSKAKQPPQFTYSGQYAYQESVAADGTVNWELALLTSGDLVWQKIVPGVDIFLVGGGDPGTRGSGNAVGGSGGAGGECATRYAVPVSAGQTYGVSIGGSGVNTTALGYTATHGGGAAGGLGAICQGTGRQRAASAGANGAYAFGADSSLLYSGRRYGAGGGGAECVNSSWVWSYSWDHGGSNAGGSTGGGQGSTSNDTPNGGNGTANTGSGGGGSFMNGAQGSTGNPGSGGSGIVIIRNAR